MFRAAGVYDEPITTGDGVGIERVVGALKT